MIGRTSWVKCFLGSSMGGTRLTDAVYLENMEQGVFALEVQYPASNDLAVLEPRCLLRMLQYCLRAADDNLLRRRRVGCGDEAVWRHGLHRSETR